MSTKSAPRYRNVALKPDAYATLRRIAAEDRRTLGATIERLLAAAEVLR